LAKNINLPEKKVLGFKAKIFKTLGDPNRVKILEILRTGERCQCEIIPILNQSQPTVSRHLKLLEDIGLIQSWKDGTRVIYKVIDPCVFTLLDAIDENMIALISKELAKKIGI